MATGTPTTLGFYSTTQSPIDEREYNNGVPYTNEAQVLSLLPFTSRHISLRIDIAGVLHRFQSDLMTLEIIPDASNQVAEEVNITDTENLFEATNVEDALAELATKINDINEGESNVYTISLSASDNVTGKISGATITVGGVNVTGWTLSATGDSGKNLQITHTLTGRTIANVWVKTVEESGNRILVPFRDAYSGILENGLTVTIEGLATNDLPLIIKLIFD